MRAKSSDRFSIANDLWFERGHLRRALQIYRELALEQPDNPVFLYQLARALAALDQLDEAGRVADQALLYSAVLNDQGRKLLARLRAQLSHPPHRSHPTIPVESLDVEAMESANATPGGWQAVSMAANERELYGLAAEALARSLEGPDHEVMREIARARLDAGLDRDLLETMVDDPRRERAPVEEPAALHERFQAPTPQHAPPSATRGPATATPSEPDRAAALPTLPLRLTAAAIPRESLVGSRVDLEVSLSNPGDSRVLVNGRLLLVPPGSVPGDGELTVGVSGPPEYVNQRGTFVRSGEPAASDFVWLSPGERIVRQAPLYLFESLHLPGRYVVHVTYRNTTQYAADGNDALVGIVEAETGLDRTQLALS
jgi:hypothetical protein